VKPVNDKKICFIMCSNDETLANECLLYISQLKVPEGFEIETLVVRDAVSMCAGYNEAMRASDAKYKIYLHQDVLLIYRDILARIVGLFEMHPEVGMLGMVGSTSLADDGCQWSDGLHRRIGEILADTVNDINYSMFGKADGDYKQVLVLDGLFMATQYDIPWREDLFGGWDFYDSSQSLEFWKAGYQVAVPYMSSPWCMHDNDVPNYENYDRWRTIFVDEYKDMYQGKSVEELGAAKGRIALCVPTMGHAAVVRDVLDKCAGDYCRYGIDMYYYDSSEDDETLKVVESFKALGYNNLHYIKVASEFSYDQKIELIYNGYGLLKTYDYIWPAKDRSYCPTATLRKILTAIEDGNDFIMLGAGFNNIEFGTYTDSVQFYYDWAWLATSLDVMLYRYSTVLKQYNSEEFNKIHNQEYMGPWRVYVFLFNKIAEEGVSVKVLSGADIIIFNSDFGKSTWTKDTFKIWKDYWISANDDLPECYNRHKAAVIKEVASLPWILGDVERLTELHELGVLVPEALEGIERNWERVSDLPIEELRQIAYGGKLNINA